MKHRKMNMPVYLTLGLCTVLMVLCLILATGTSFARYRMDQKLPLAMEARAQDQVYLGRMTLEETTGEPVMDLETGSIWQTVDGETRLEFTVANGTDGENYAREAQRVYVRLIGTLDVRMNGTGPVLKLLVPPEEDGEEAAVYTGVPERIPQGTQLHLTFGDGWIYRFCDENGEEVFQTLEGGALNWMDMKLLMEGYLTDYSGLLQLQITSDYTLK